MDARLRHRSPPGHRAWSPRSRDAAAPLVEPVPPDAAGAVVAGDRLALCDVAARVRADRRSLSPDVETPLTRWLLGTPADVPEPAEALSTSRSTPFQAAISLSKAEGPKGVTRLSSASRRTSAYPRPEPRSGPSALGHLLLPPIGLRTSQMGGFLPVCFQARSQEKQMSSESIKIAGRWLCASELRYWIRSSFAWRRFRSNVVRNSLHIDSNACIHLLTLLADDPDG
jgi:hypothetical protein